MIGSSNFFAKPATAKTSPGDGYHSQRTSPLRIDVRRSVGLPIVGQPPTRSVNSSRESSRVSGLEIDRNADRRTFIRSVISYVTFTDPRLSRSRRVVGRSVDESV